MKKKNNPVVEEALVVETPTNVKRKVRIVEVERQSLNEEAKEPVEENKGHRRRHLQANKLNESGKKSMATRIISAVIGLMILVPALFLGDWIYFAFITLALLVACWEILGCANKRTFFIFLVYFLFVGSLVYWPIFKELIVNGGLIVGGKIDSYYTSIYISVLMTAIGTFFLFFLTVVYKDFTVQDAAFLIAMGILIGLGFESLFFLRYYPLRDFGVNGLPAFTFTKETTIKPSLLIIFVVIGTFMTDTGAYFVGVFFGKNKMNERISPKKTWEGFVGGIVISFLLTATLGLVLAACDYPLLPSLGLNRWYNILILSAIIPIFATLGDFVFSSIKRYWGIKDYGKLIPGHGGVLDRLDSIFFAAIISAIFIFMLSCATGDGVGTLDWSKFLV